MLQYTGAIINLENILYDHPLFFILLYLFIHYIVTYLSYFAIRV